MIDPSLPGTDPSLPGTSSGSVGVSRRRARKSPVEIEQDSCEEREKTESCASEGNESESKENSPHGKAPKYAKTSQKSANTE